MAVGWGEGAGEVVSVVRVGDRRDCRKWWRQLALERKRPAFGGVGLVQNRGGVDCSKPPKSVAGAAPGSNVSRWAHVHYLSSNAQHYMHRVKRTVVR